MSDIHNQFDAATRQVSAAAILHDGKHVGNAVIKYPRDGAGRLYFYLQIYGATMVRGSATGYGYDKRSAAFQSACERLDPNTDTIGYAKAHIAAAKAAAESIVGQSWDSAMRDAGFQIAFVC